MAAHAAPRKALIHLAAFALLALAISACCTAGALATALTPGDVVIYRVGSGSETLSSAAATVWLDEFAPAGSLVQSLALPTSVSGANKRLVASGKAGSEGLLTLSEDGAYLMMTGYNAAVATAKISETTAASAPRTIGRVSGSGEINTETALTDFANQNNPRSAASTEGTKIWVGGAGKSTTGGVHYTTLGASTSTVLNENDTNVRQVEVVDGQLYTSADPTKTGTITIASVGSGLPTSGTKNTITNLPFATSPKQPYAYSLLTLGLGTAPDTLYVADNERQAIVKYNLIGGSWLEEGSVEVPYVTGLTANDVGNSGVVTIYATSSGENGGTGSLYKVQDVSGFGGTFSGVAGEIATAPANEAFRGVAFAPGTTIGSGGTPPTAPTITTPENVLAGALGDPTNASLAITVGDSEYAASELTVTVHSSNTTVAPQAGITISGSGGERTLSVAPAALGESKLTVTVEAPNKVSKSTLVKYGASPNLGNSSDRYYAGVGNCSSAIDVGGGYFICGDDTVNVLHLYHGRTSSEPVASYDFTGVLPFGATEMDIEASARAGNTLYWMGSLSNKHNGELRPSANVLFAATITGSGAGTALSYLGSYTHLREDLIEWDNANGGPLGFAASTEAGAHSDLASGFNAEGLEFAAGSTSEAYIAFRAPLEPPGEGPEDRNRALMVPVTNLSELVTGATKATFGPAIEWNLGGLAIREIRRNAEGEYLVIAGTADGSNSSFALYGWDGEPDVGPVLLGTTPNLEALAEGAWESVVSVPAELAAGDQVELLEDNGDTEWYCQAPEELNCTSESKLTSKNGLPAGLQKDLGRLFTVAIPTPATPGAPALLSGGNPNSGHFTLRWKPSPALHPTFTLQHENAKGGWSTVASAITGREYTFTAGSPESEGTWTYRVKERNRSEAGESAYSAESEAIKVDRTAPNTPSASASRAPDYAGGGGWYKDSVKVSFKANGDPALADGSEGSGVEASSLSASQTFEASGSHEACGTVEDNAGNVSAPGCLTVHVDATAPTLEINCPASVLVGETGVEATVTASDGQSGLASDPSGKVSIGTSTAGPVTITRTATDNVGHETTRSCETVVKYPTPGAPTLSAGTNPNASGLFELTWTGADPLEYLGLTYTLQQHNASTPTWSTVAPSIGSTSYEFNGAGEPEGTWVYRVKGTDVGGNTTTYSAVSEPVVVDKSSPFPPEANPTRGPDYAGGGGWYKDSVEVLFTSNGDRVMADGSPGSGVDPASLPSPVTFATSGAHRACGKVSDNVGHMSTEGCSEELQVDATPPSLGIACPKYAAIGQTGVEATVTASDGQSGLASDPSGTVSIDTSTAGAKMTQRTAIDNVGHETTVSCTTLVVPPPTVTKSSPAKGTAGGGTIVTIKGTGFVEVTAVKFGSADAASFAVLSPTKITAVTPATVGGVAYVTVTNLAGTSNVIRKARFKFVPQITGVSPGEGSRAGGTTVTVQGAGFVPGTNTTPFKFGNALATAVKCANTTECTMQSPGARAGTVDVTVTLERVKSPKTVLDKFKFN